MSDSSTRELLSNRRKDPPYESTASLINDGLCRSTGSLVSGNLSELLRKVKMGSTQRPHIDIDIGENLGQAWDQEHFRSSVSSVFENHSLEGTNSSSKGEVRDEVELLERISLLLESNSLSPDFGYVFRNYLILLHEKGCFPEDDYYFRVVKEGVLEAQDLSADFAKVLELFLFNPVNGDMKLALLEYEVDKAVLIRSLEAWKLQWQGLRNLDRLQNVWNNYVAQRAYICWQKALKENIYHSHEEASNFRNFQLKSNMLSRWISHMDTFDLKETVANGFFLQKRLVIFAKKFDEILQRSKSAEEFRQNSIVLAAWRSWKLKSQAFQLRHRLEKKKLINCMNLLLRRQQASLEVSEKARILFEFVLKEGSLKKWEERMTDVRRKEDVANNFQSYYLKKEAFSHVKMASLRKEYERAARRSVNSSLLRFCFKNIWHKRHREARQVRQFLATKSLGECHSYFDLWRQRTEAVKAATTFCENELKKRAGKRFRTGLRAYDYSKSWRLKKGRRAIARWRHETALQERLRKMNDKSLSSFWVIYRTKYFQELKNAGKADVLRELLLTRFFFFKWLERKQRVMDLQQKAYIQEKFKAIHFLRKGALHSKEVKLLLQIRDMKLSNRPIMMKYMNVWRENLRIQLKLRRESMLDQYLIFKGRSRLQLFFNEWFSIFQSYTVDCVRMSQILSQKHLRTMSFGAVRRKFDIYSSWFLVSERLNRQSVLLKFFSQMRTKLATLEMMDAQATEQISAANARSVVKCLNNWSMKQLKCRRNSDTVVIFRRRWDRATQRAVLALWREKVYTEREDSRLHHNTETFKLSTTHHLTTPSRYRETNQPVPDSELIKRNRMEAMKTQYQRARRAIPSPIKSSESLNKSAKKRLTSSTEDSGQKFPSPPKLDLNKVNSRLANKGEHISFKAIPKATFSPLASPKREESYEYYPVLDRTSLSEGTDDFNDSPTRR
ncbi:LAMI_0H09076g1_1 [Lachancea mirantina]|uniref:LAMI_0H09076g1_1 n=1 Tax=Lachancea mirantina TaxID=1230905 RepID=A0A1G4KGD1_9SACH|nr:LAMI_0H09076g1_1 [Lachancea mirantina]